MKMKHFWGCVPSDVREGVFPGFSPTGSGLQGKIRVWRSLVDVYLLILQTSACAYIIEEIRLEVSDAKSIKQNSMISYLSGELTIENIYTICNGSVEKRKALESENSRAFLVRVSRFELEAS